MAKPTKKQKRTQARKARQLAAGEANRKVLREPTQRECHITATRYTDHILFQSRVGYFAPRTGAVFALYDLEIVDALENPGALIEAIMKAGLAALSSLLRVPAIGLPGKEVMTKLAQAAADWLKLDVEVLKAAIEAERKGDKEEDKIAEAIQNDGPVAEKLMADELAAEVREEQRQGVADDPAMASMVDLGGEG